MASPFAHNERTMKALSLMCLVGAGTVSACGFRSARSKPPADAVQAVAVLERVREESPARWWGMGNIFFAKVTARDSVHIGSDWRDVEVADIARTDGLVPVVVARFRSSGSDDLRYVVDTTGTFDFTHGVTLSFERRGPMMIADIALDVRSLGGTHMMVPYQILLSDDHYTYARIAEYRAGRFRVAGRDYAVRLRGAWRDRPFYGLDQGTKFLVHLDGDGQVVEDASVSVGGRPAAADEVMAGAPFFLNGRPYEFAALDSAGLRLEIRSSTVTAAAVAGFVAPDLAALDVRGMTYRLKSDSGKVVLLEFWSVECPYSEKVREPLNDLVMSLPGTRLSWVAMALENDGARVQDHLREHPMNATVTVIDSSAWRTYNPMTVTPLFVLVDERGIVRFRGTGVSSLPAVANKVRELLAVAR